MSSSELVTQLLHSQLACVRQSLATLDERTVAIADATRGLALAVASLVGEVRNLAACCGALATGLEGLSEVGVSLDKRVSALENAEHGRGG